MLSLPNHKHYTIHDLYAQIVFYVKVCDIFTKLKEELPQQFFPIYKYVLYFIYHEMTFINVVSIHYFLDFTIL